jgi:hypothetical protein
MANTITFTGLPFEDAKEVLAAAYSADAAATFINNFQLHGSVINAKMSKNVEKSKGSSLTWYDVMIESSYLSEASLREMFAPQLHKFC